LQSSAKILLLQRSWNYVLVRIIAAIAYRPLRQSPKALLKAGQ